jgi:hypothetical protein
LWDEALVLAAFGVFFMLLSALRFKNHLGRSSLRSEFQIFKTGIGWALGLRGSNSAIRATLINESIPRSQKIVGSSALTNSSPTIDVEVVFETC